MCQTRTQVFSCQFCNIFKNSFFIEHLRMLLPLTLKPMDSVMQMNFWISHDLVYVNTRSSSWNFCVYFWQAQTFRCFSTVSLKFDNFKIFFDKEG